LCAEETTAPVKALVVTGGHWYDAAALKAAMDSVPNMKYEELELTRDAEMFDDIELLMEYNVIIFYSMMQEMQPHQFENMNKLFEEGIGFFFLHHGVLSWVRYPGMAEIVGIEFEKTGGFVFQLNQRFWYEVQDSTHPITRGLDNFLIADESYGNFYGDGYPGTEVLITTEHEATDPPLVWTRQRGNSDICVLVGGHDAAALKDPSFQELLVRCVYWTAGRSDDLFTLKAGQVLPQVGAWTFGEDQTALSKVEGLAKASAHDEALADLLRESMAIQLKAESTTDDARDFILRLFAERWPHKSVEAASEYLIHDRLSNLARRVMEGARNKAAEQALLVALDQAEGTIKLGLLQSIGEAGSNRSIESLMTVVESGEQKPSQRAVAALGALGTVQTGESLKALARHADGSLREAIIEARIACARNLNRKGDSENAKSILLEIMVSGEGAPGYFPALRVLATVSEEAALEVLLKGLEKEAGDYCAEYMTVVYLTKSSISTQRLIELIDNLPVEKGDSLFGALHRRSSSALLKAAKARLESKSPAVQKWVLYVLGGFGSNDVVVPILEKASSNNAEIAEAAQRALDRLNADGTNEILFNILEQEPGLENTGLVVEAMSALARRSAPTILPEALEHLSSSQRELRNAAVAALEIAATESDVPLLLDTLNKASEKRLIRSLEKIIAPLLLRIETTDTMRSLLQGALGTSSGDSRLALLRLTASLEDENVFEMLTSLDKEEKERAEIIRALADWDSSSAVEYLFNKLNSDPVDKNRRLALRGYLRQNGRLAQRDESAALEGIQRVMEAIISKEEKQQLLSTLGRIQHPEALAIAKDYLEDSQVRDTAFITVAELAVDIALLDPDSARQTLRELDTAGLPDFVIERVESARERLKEIESGIVGYWNFSKDIEGWEAANHCELSAADGALVVKTTGIDPYLTYPLGIGTGAYTVKMRVKFSGVVNPLVYYWDTDETPIGSSGTFIGINFKGDLDEWQEFEYTINITGKMNYFRIDPGSEEGTVLIDYVMIRKNTPTDQPDSR
jgi:type 1 glutamine amidotransferase